MCVAIAIGRYRERRTWSKRAGHRDRRRHLAPTRTTAATIRIRPVTAWERRLPLALIACGLVLGAVSLATAPRSARRPAGPRRGSHRPLRRSTPLSGPIPRIAIAYDVGGRGSAGFNELAWEGVKRAAGEFDAEIKEITAGPDDTDADREERLTELAEDRYYPIFAIGSTWAGSVAKVAAEVPRHLVRHRRRRHRERAEGDRHPVQRGAGLLPRRSGRRPHVEDGQRRLRRRGPDRRCSRSSRRASRRVPGPPIRTCRSRSPYLSRPPASAGLRRPGQGQEGRAGHVRRGRRCDLRGGRRLGQRGDPGCPRSGALGDRRQQRPVPHGRPVRARRRS